MIGPRKRAGTARPARVIGLRLQHGVPVCDVVDGAGNTYLNCRFAGAGGGATAFVYAPPLPSTDESATPNDSDGAEVLVSVGDGRSPHAFVVGALPNPTANKRIAVVERPGDGADYDAKTGLRDFSTENNGARVLVSEFGLVVLDTTGSAEPVYIQLDAASYLRISQDGDATERLPLAGPMRDVIDALTDKVNEQGAMIASLIAQIKLAIAAGVATPGAAAPAFTAMQGVMASAAYLHTPAAPTTDAVVASAVRISAQSLADE